MASTGQTSSQALHPTHLSVMRNIAENRSVEAIVTSLEVYQKQGQPPGRLEFRPEAKERDMPRIGAHVVGGIKGGVAKALEIQAEALQIFVGSPQTWRPPNPSAAEVSAFRDGVLRSELGPVF